MLGPFPNWYLHWAGKAWCLFVSFTLTLSWHWKEGSRKDPALASLAKQIGSGSAAVAYEVEETCLDLSDGETEPEVQGVRRNGLISERWKVWLAAMHLGKAPTLCVRVYMGAGTQCIGWANFCSSPLVFASVNEGRIWP